MKKIYFSRIARKDLFNIIKELLAMGYKARINNPDGVKMKMKDFEVIKWFEFAAGDGYKCSLWIHNKDMARDKRVKELLIEYMI